MYRFNEAASAGTSQSRPYPVPAPRRRVPSTAATQVEVYISEISNSSVESLWESYEDIERQEIADQQAQITPYVEPRTFRFDCSICYETYTEKENQVTSFFRPSCQCNYICICFKCVIKLYSENNGNPGQNSKIRCPFCNVHAKFWEAYTDSAVIQCRLVRKSSPRAPEKLADHWKYLLTELPTTAVAPAESPDMQQLVSKHSKEMEDVCVRYTEAVDSLEQANSKINTMQEDLTEKQNALNVEKFKNNNLSVSLAHVTKELSELQAEMGRNELAYKQEIEQLKTDGNTMKAEIDRLEKDNQLLKQQVAEKQQTEEFKEIEKLKKENHSLRQRRYSAHRHEQFKELVSTTLADFHTKNLYELTNRMFTIQNTIYGPSSKK
ncbi:PE38 [Parapoynx stagnalis nucleopolyhedrovirus]|uniref:PE38 n=1 Tax=Parapoynx stagnalis nucleopolyhedrovirus TaxID=2993413 RepID=A0A9E7YIC7_9ABAC|nr:PE38 [Parapoynx stagnalis nucleopolyhedrovirus]